MEATTVVAMTEVAITTTTVVEKTTFATISLARASKMLTSIVVATFWHCY